jgi:hypothetical protein
MARVLKTLAVVFILALSFAHWQPVEAHNKSLSFSNFLWGGDAISVSFTAPARDVTLLPSVQTQRSLSDALGAHVSANLRLSQMNMACKITTPFAKAPSRASYIRVIGEFQCYDASSPIRVENNAFFDLARSHVHFARFGLTADKTQANTKEILFTATQRYHVIRANETGGLEAEVGFGEVFQNYFWLGMSHILTGYDHLAFVLCLLLVAPTQRRAIWLISGFTVGHSATLIMATLGWVVPNPNVVEALIGASIALMAAEPILSRGTLMARSGAVAALVLFVASGIGIVTGSVLPLGAWAGLILFCLCYGLLIDGPAAMQRYAPTMTLAFGFIHGFGFAGLLTDIGLPSENLVAGLFSFNLGVEVGQLLVLIPAFVFIPILLEELPSLSNSKIRWSDIAASSLTAFGLYLFVSRALL